MTGQKYSGVIPINKGLGITSHDVVYKLRKILGTKKIGHAGTLDPNVSGLLLVCVGKATKIVQYLQDYDKVYEGMIKLGARTDSQDATGNTVKESSYMPSFEEIQAIGLSYIGEIKQIPPMFSAVHHKGVRLHELARQGIEVERKPRDAKIYDLVFSEYKYPYLSFKCACSKGTYIRTLMNDIGDDLGCFAHLYSMTRVKSQGFNIGSSYELNEIKDMVVKGDLSFFTTIDEALMDYPVIKVPDEHFKDITNGMKITVDLCLSSNIHKVYCRGEFIGLGQVKDVRGTNKLVLDKMLYV